MYVLIIVTFNFTCGLKITSARHNRASTPVIGGTISLPWILFRVHYNSCPYSCKNGNVPLHSIVSVNYNYVYLLHSNYMSTVRICTGPALLDARKVELPGIRVAGYMKIYGIELCSVCGKLVPALLLWVN